VNWNSVALQVTLSAKPDPPREARSVAMVQLAVLDAVTTSDGDPAVIAAAARDVLAALYPARAAELATLAPGEPSAAARTVLAGRAHDHADDPTTLTPVEEVGRWRPTPPAMAAAVDAGWGRVTPFLLGRGDRFRPAAPDPLTSAAYTRDFRELVDVGSVTSTTRTADQTQAAQFWKATAAQEWDALARNLAIAEHLSVLRTAHLLAELSLAQADAAIAAWDTKFTYLQWRPITGIRLAADDGNPDTTPLADWTPLIPTPPFPDYVCGHTALGGASQRVLEHWFGAGERDDLALTSPALPGVTRHWPTFAALGQEVLDARVWGGVHWRTSCERGRTLGEQVGSWTLTHAP
jgi:hypothetical protein